MLILGMAGSSGMVPKEKKKKEGTDLTSFRAHQIHTPSPTSPTLKLQQAVLQMDVTLKGKIS